MRHVPIQSAGWPPLRTTSVFGDVFACLSAVIFEWGWRNWLLLVLAAVAVGGYFGVLPTVERALELPTAPAAIERLASQPTVTGSFSEPFHGRMDAWMVIFLFIFLSPLALFMAVTIGILLLSVLAGTLAPVVGGERIAMLVVELGSGIAIFLTRDSWLPQVMYFLGLIARAYVVVSA